MRVLAIVVVTLAACGGGSDDVVDAMPDSDDSARCLIPDGYGNLGTMTGTTSMGPSTLTITLDAGPPRDSFFLKLVSGKGVFAGGLSTGTFSIGGVDASFNDCGLCVNIIADIVTGSGPTKFYFADSGSVTLTATTPPAGTLSNVHFVEVNLATGMPAASGCDGSIGMLAFSGS
jgi:hypothetical protein